MARLCVQRDHAHMKQSCLKPSRKLFASKPGFKATNETDLQSGKHIYPWRRHFFQALLLFEASFVTLSNVVNTMSRNKDSLLKSGTVIFELHSTRSWMFRSENKWLTPSRHPYGVISTDKTLSEMLACWRRFPEVTRSGILKGLPGNAMERAFWAMVCS